MDRKFNNEFEKQKNLKKEEFVRYVRKICAGCLECGSIDFRENMLLVEDNKYYCSDCAHE